MLEDSLDSRSGFFWVESRGRGDWDRLLAAYIGQSNADFFYISFIFLLKFLITYIRFFLLSFRDFSRRPSSFPREANVVYHPLWKMWT